MTLPEEPPNKPALGFVTPEEKSGKPTTAKPIVSNVERGKK
jgi:hypothetical protein